MSDTFSEIITPHDYLISQEITPLIKVAYQQDFESSPVLKNNNFNSEFERFFQVANQIITNFIEDNNYQIDPAIVINVFSNMYRVVSEEDLFAATMTAYEILNKKDHSYLVLNGRGSNKWFSDVLEYMGIQKNNMITKNQFEILRKNKSSKINVDLVYLDDIAHSTVQARKGLSMGGGFGNEISFRDDDDFPKGINPKVHLILGAANPGKVARFLDIKENPNHHKLADKITLIKRIPSLKDLIKILGYEEHTEVISEVISRSLGITTNNENNWNRLFCFTNHKIPDDLSIPTNARALSMGDEVIRLLPQFQMRDYPNPEEFVARNINN